MENYSRKKSAQCYNKRNGFSIAASCHQALLICTDSELFVRIPGRRNNAKGSIYESIYVIHYDLVTELI